MSQDNGKPWSRRQWVLYWLFIVAYLFTTTVFGVAVELGNRAAAGAVLAAAGAIAAIWFVVVVVRIARNP